MYYVLRSILIGLGTGSGSILRFLAKVPFHELSASIVAASWVDAIDSDCGIRERNHSVTPLLGISS